MMMEISRRIWYKFRVWNTDEIVSWSIKASLLGLSVWICGQQEIWHTVLAKRVAIWIDGDCGTLNRFTSGLVHNYYFFSIKLNFLINSLSEFKSSHVFKSCLKSIQLIRFSWYLPKFMIKVPFRLTYVWLCIRCEIL